MGVREFDQDQKAMVEIFHQKGKQDGPPRMNLQFDTELKQVHWSTSSAILFQNGNHLKISSSNKIAPIIMNQFQ